MTKPIVSRDHTLDQWRTITNRLAHNIGDPERIMESGDVPNTSGLVGDSVSNSTDPYMHDATTEGDVSASHVGEINAIVLAINNLNSRKVKRTGDVITGGFGVTGVLQSQGDTHLGRAASNPQNTTLTIYGTAVAIPNSLNFNSATLYVDVASKVGIGAAPSSTETFQVTGNSKLTGTLQVTGNAQFDADIDVRGSDITTNQTTFNLLASTATTINAFSAVTTLNLGNASAAQTVNIGNASTGTSTYNIGTGAPSTGNTKSVNIATNGDVGSTTNINVGSSVAGTLTVLTPLSIIPKVAGSITTTQDLQLQANSANTSTGRVIILTTTDNGGDASSGALVVGGGAAIASKLYVGSDTLLKAAVTVNGTGNVLITTTGTATISPTSTTTLGTLAQTTTLLGNISAASAAQTIILSPTGAAGTVTIAPGTLTGSINNMNVGASVRGTGAFTTLASNGATTFTLATDNTLGTVASGAVQVTSGLGVGGNVTIGGDLQVKGGDVVIEGTPVLSASVAANAVSLFASSTSTITVGSASSTTLALNSVSQTVGQAAGTFTLNSGTATLNSNTTVTGTKTFTVGTGLTTLGGALTVTGVATFNGASLFTSVTDNSLGTVASGSVQISGGMGVGGNATIGGDVQVKGGDIIIEGTPVISASVAANAVSLFASSTGTITLGSATSTTLTLNSVSQVIGQTAGTFTLNSGTATINSNTSITGTKTFTVGTGLTTLGGALTVTGTTTLNGAVTASPANANVTISPTGTGTVTISPVAALTINPTAASTINNCSIGASTRSTGAFTSLAANGATAFTSATDNTLGTVASGAVQVTGGLGVGGNATVGGDLQVKGGDVVIEGTPAISAATTISAVSLFTGSTGAITIGNASGSTIVNSSLQVGATGSSVTLTVASGDIVLSNGTDAVQTIVSGVAASTAAVFSTTNTATLNLGLEAAVNISKAAKLTTINGTLTVAQAATFNGAVTASPASANVTISPTGTGSVTISPVGALTINPTAASTINNCSIGATTQSTGAFTTLSASGVITSTVTTGTAPFTVASTTKVTNLNADTLDGTDWSAPGTIGGTTPGAGNFSTLSATSGITGTISTASQTNITAVGTLGSLAVTNDVTFGTNTVINTATITTTTASANQKIASFAKATYRSCEFLVQGVAAGAFTLSKVLVVHDGTNSDYVEYGRIDVGGATFSLIATAVNGADIELRVTPAAAVSTVWKVTMVLTKV
jgi:hypothetical protein